MKFKFVNILTGLAASLTILSLCGAALSLTAKQTNEAPAARLHASPTVEPAVTPAKIKPSTRSEKIAGRIDRRLKARDLPTPGVTVLARAVERRDGFIKNKVTVMLDPGTSGAAAHSGTLILDPHHTWVQFTGTRRSASFDVNADAVRASLEHGEVTELKLRQNLEIVSAAKDHKDVLRAQTNGTGKPGYIIDTKMAAHTIASAFMEGTAVVTIPASYGEPDVMMLDANGTAKRLTLLGTGMSDFADSAPGREWNVHKAIDERINKVIVPAGQTFSLISALDAPITLEKGWKNALGLFGGGAAMTPGGGICQSATTLYRAALLAGLPIAEKRNHSLFVDHYEFYGVGLDATVFPGFHDVRFTNDTGEDIYLHAYTEGITVYVKMYGHDDGRRATLDGPYLAGTKNRHPALRPLNGYQIAWVRTIAYPDGTRKDEPFYATYAKPLFRYLHKYAGAGMKLMTTREI